jgi:predicted SAM-dependent methyltransferase
MDEKKKKFLEITKSLRKINLNLGCGKRNFNNFINIDLAKYKHIHFNEGVDKLDFIPNNSIDYIYSSHVLEYFDYDKGLSILKIWKQKLKPKGKLRISVPDFNSLIKVYKKTNQIKKIIGPLFGKTKSKVYHKCVYDEKMLTTQLKSAGYKKVSHYDWKKTFHAKYDDHSQAFFPHMNKKDGLQISINMECQK